MKTTRLIAVLPARIRRRWDALAARQLAEVAVTLAADNEQLTKEVYWAEQSADMWQRVAEIEQERGTVGLTITGHIVNADRNPGATIDDDPEYRGRLQ